jgi:hypothetical protein
MVALLSAAVRRAARPFSSTRSVAAAVSIAVASALASPLAEAARVILNEYNGVSSSNYLNGGDEFMDGDGNVPPPADAFFGRVPGNGGDWFELVVIGDHVDVRGWSLSISDDGVAGPTLVFTENPLWSDLRAGTIVTVAEDVPDDPSYDPANGDWWIHVRAADPENGGTGTYITASDFPVSNDDWQLTILDRDGGVVFGPAGEGIVGDDGVPLDVGVNSEEVFALAGTPSAEIARDSEFYSDRTVSSFGAPNDLGTGILQSFEALRQGLPVPDRDGDGVADDGDRSGVIGDNPCTGGATENCDDNCPTQPDPAQTDTGGILNAGPDGIGDACQCGDADDDGVLTAGDVDDIRDNEVTAPEKCSVTGGTECNLADAAALVTALRGDPGAISQVCTAAVVPEDESDILFDPNRIIQVNVTMDPELFDDLRKETWDWHDRLNFPECGIEPWPSPFTWFMADSVTIDGQTFVRPGIRKKGFLGSLSVKKPALKLELDRFVAGQQIHDITEFTFNNARQDPSLVRQCLSFAFFRRAGIVAPRCNFAHVVVNGEDLGIYASVDTIKEPFLARNFGAATGPLWEGTVSDFWPGSWSGTFEPETDAAEDDRTVLDATATALATLSGQALLTELRKYVDIRQFISYWAAEAVVSHVDGYHHNGNNYFVYGDPTKSGLQFFPWDADQDFSARDTSIYDIRMALARKLYNIPQTRALFLQRVQWLLDNAWRADISLAEIQRMRALLIPELIAAGKQNEIPEMIAAQDILRDLISGRRDAVLQQLANPPASVPDEQQVHPCDGGGGDAFPGPVAPDL